MTRVGVLLTAMSLGVAACGLRGPAADPTPANVGSSAPDSGISTASSTQLDSTPTPVNETAVGPRSSAAPRADERTVREPVRWDIPIVINSAVHRWLEYFQNDGRQNFAVYLARAGRFEPMMRAMLRDAGLPEDLVYLSLIESGFSPNAYSRAHAVGLWQFIASTGRNYGLDVSYWVDERRDPILATRAAVAHLADLYEEFGSWYLAAAAYNGGPTRVRRSIRRSGSTDFWTLARRRYLRRETRNYVPKLIAAALIAKQPERYGFVDVPRAEPFSYDLVRVPEATSVDVIAAAAGVPVARVAELNPQLLRGVTPPGGPYVLRVPPGSGHLFATRYAGVPADERVTWVQHVIRRGETLSAIARSYGVSVSAIYAANRGIHARRLKVGQRLVIPRSGTLPALTGGIDGSPDGRYITHRVQPGDTLWAIARRYAVTTRQLMAWNGLTSSRIYPGDEVKVFVGS